MRLPEIFRFAYYGIVVMGPNSKKSVAKKPLPISYQQKTSQIVLFNCWYRSHGKVFFLNCWIQENVYNFDIFTGQKYIKYNWVCNNFLSLSRSSSSSDVSPSTNFKLFFNKIISNKLVFCCTHHRFDANSLRMLCHGTMNGCSSKSDMFSSFKYSFEICEILTSSGTSTILISLHIIVLNTKCFPWIFSYKYCGIHFSKI